MYKQYKISAILPCRNEGNHLEEVVSRIPSIVDEVIVVSNKSTDNTVEVAKSLGLKVYEDNRTINGIGYGFAHMTGIQKATGDILVAIDGDATYPIEELEKILNHMDVHSLDFVSCNRYPLKDGTKIPLKLRMGVQILNIETYILYGKHIKDVLSGMWVFKKEIKDDLHLTMGDWNLSPQIKINAFTNSHISSGEYSIAQHTRKGETKQNYFATGFSHLLWIASNRVGLGNFENQYVARFFVVGLSAFIVNALILSLLTHILHIEKITSEIVAMVLTLQLSFYLHDNWTYKLSDNKNDEYKKPILMRYGSFIISNVFGAIITVAVYSYFIQLTLPVVALAIGSVIAMVWNFIFNRFVIWSHRSK